MQNQWTISLLILSIRLNNDTCNKKHGHFLLSLYFLSYPSLFCLYFSLISTYHWYHWLSLSPDGHTLIFLLVVPFDGLIFETVCTLYGSFVWSFITYTDARNETQPKSNPTMCCMVSLGFIIITHHDHHHLHCRCSSKHNHNRHHRQSMSAKKTISLIHTFNVWFNGKIFENLRSSMF